MAVGCAWVKRRDEDFWKGMGWPCRGVMRKCGSPRSGDGVLKVRVVLVTMYGCVVAVAVKKGLSLDKSGTGAAEGAQEGGGGAEGGEEEEEDLDLDGLEIDDLGEDGKCRDGDLTIEG